MPSMTFEEQLRHDIQGLCNRSRSPITIHITRWGQSEDEWVSWDVDLIVQPERMDADGLALYAELGRILSREPYCILEEGITPDRIGYMVSAIVAAC